MKESAEASTGIYTGTTPARRRLEDRTASTGQHCPTSGAWSSPLTGTVTFVFLKGQLMPCLGGQPVEWQLCTGQSGSGGRSCRASNSILVQDTTANDSAVSSAKP